MALRVVHRPTRTTHPAPEQEPREVEAPPTLPDGKSQGNPLMTVLPLVGMMASLSIMMVMRNPAFMALGAVMLCVALLGAMVMLFSKRGQVGRQRRNQRELYLQYLEELRETLSEWEHETRAHARLIDPAPEALYDVLRDPRRLWERRRRHADFLKVRVGTGMAPGRPLNLAEQGTALTPTDPFMQSEAQAVIRRFETIPDMPFTLPLDMTGNISVVGEREDIMRLVRAMVAQFGVFHAPEDAGIAVAYPEENADDWSWLLWFPQVLDPQRREAGVAARLIAPTPRELGMLLSDELRSRSDFASEVRRGMGRREAYQMLRRLLVIHDTHGEIATELVRPDHTVDPAALGVTVLHLVSRQIDEPSDVNIRVTVKGDEVVVEDLQPTDPVITSGTLDDVSPATLTGLARMIAPLRLSPESVEETAQEGGRVDFPAMMGVRDPGNMDVQRLWAPRSERAFLRVPIGVDEMGQPLVLDLKESAQLGMGPHGLCVGATGSGKSEMLRTLVLALAASHPPERVSMVLVDYKGGATFAPFEDMPHVAGMITNLEDDAALIERVHASLSGEVQRRQQMLRDAGNVPNIGDYAHKREKDPGLPPMPHLLVIIDEFGELLTARPDFIELFLSIGRIGRSIGVHLLLSSQRIEGGKLRGLDTYLSYRLGLRTFSEEESRTVLNTPDAFHLPSLPGFGYLKVDTTVYQRFKAGYVSGAYRGPVIEEEEDDEGKTPSPRLYTAYNPPPEEEAERPEPSEGSSMPSRTTGPTLLDVLVNQLGRHGEPTRAVWLPPLPSATTLDEVAGTPEETEHGLRLPGERPALNVPIGLLDDATRQWQGEWLLDLNASGGHVAVIGGPQSGKTTLLRTLVLSLALTHTPEQVSVYCLDMLGGGLQTLSGLPHVGGVAVRTDVERVRRTIEEVRGMLEHREEVFRERGIDSVEQLRRRHARGEVPELASADIVLCVDGYGALRKDFEEVEAVVNELLQRGGGYGIHVVGAMLRWNDVRMAAQSNFGQRVELHLNNPGDSSIARKLSETIKEDASGRALTSSKLFAQTCLPRFDGAPSTEDIGEAVEHAVRAVDRAWKGARAPEVRILPHLLSVRTLPDKEEAPATVPIGLDERALRPVQLDLFERDQNLLVLGDGECGKSNLLRMISEGFVERYSPKEVVFAIMDPRRSLRDLVPKDYVGGYATTPRVCNGLATGVAKELEGRIPQDGAEDLEPGSFSGPRVIVIADDYDVLTTAGQKPLAPFVPYISNGRDIGLHFVVARRVAGVSRAMYDPLLQSMREVGSSTLLMSGDRGEGQVFPRVYASPLPPGRGRWMPRGGATRLIQTALRDQA